MDEEISGKIRLVRIVAVILILITHILQEYSVKGFEWTYSGVQIFFILSGYLLGQKDVRCWSKWFYKRAIRLLPSYYILLVFTALLYWFTLGINIIDFKYLFHFTGLQFLLFRDYPFWGGHLWFISAIICCYCTFPFLVFCRNFFKNRHIVLLFYFVVVPLTLFLFFYTTPMPYRLAADIYSFIAGYILAAVIAVRFKYIFVFSLCSLSVFWGGKLYLVSGAVGHVDLWKEIFELLWSWEKIFIALLIMSFLLCAPLPKIASKGVVKKIDSLSYEIYLSHKNYILGKLSLLALTPYTYINIMVALTLTYITSLLLSYGAKKLIAYVPQPK